MAIFTVDSDKCQKDGICAAVCPEGVIEFNQKDPPRPGEKADTDCITCGHCLAACPTGALSLTKMPLAECPPLDRKLDLSPEQVEYFLRSRRSIRLFRSDPVPREQITRLIEIARYAPSGHNSQPVHWIVYSDPGQIKRLAGLVVDWMRVKIAQQDEMANFFDMSALVERWEDGQDIVLRKAPVVVVTHGREGRLSQYASIIAITYLELAALPFGLGSCWAGFFNVAANDYQPLAEALALPRGHKTYSALMLGRPLYSYHRLPLRNKPSITWR